MSDDRCLAARANVEATGDVLPPGFAFRCPDATYPHWGVTSGAPGAPHFIAINVARIGPSDAKLQYVIAHETCHARASQGQENFYWRDEAATDRCAANYGFPNTYFSRANQNTEQYGKTIVEKDNSILLPVALVLLTIIAAALVAAIFVRRLRPTPPVIVNVNTKDDDEE